jgi:thiamine biosynthesis lipoprotein
MLPAHKGGSALQFGSRKIERVQPWLGTFVAIAIENERESKVQRAITAAFTEIAGIHRLMSFHESGSDVSRANREAARVKVKIHAKTAAVIEQAQTIARASEGVFDITVGGTLAAGRFLTRPPGAPQPATRVSWADIEISKNAIRFRKPLWIDLGGIAKGYAVDCAIAVLVEQMKGEPVSRMSVNAGGDLRVVGSNRIALRLPWASDTIALMELEDGSLASSCGHEQRRRLRGRVVRPHLDGRSGRGVGAGSFVSVVAEQCLVADALTKVVLARGMRARTVLSAFGATAYMHSPRFGWRRFGSVDAGAQSRLASQTESPPRAKSAR